MRLRGVLKFIIALALITGFCSPVVVRAQEIITASDVTLSFNPEVPGPFQQVQATLESFVIDLNTSDITWFVNGQEKLRGTGERRFSFTTADAGTPFDIMIDILYGRGGHVVKRVRIQPADMTLMWQAVDSYVPPFYRGKALPGPESILKAVAIPGNVSNNDQYVYTWKNSGVVDQQQSGFRRNAFFIKNNFFSDIFDIAVDALSRDAQYHVQSDMQVARVQPQLLFEAQSSDGSTLYAHAGGTLSLGAQGALVTVHPLFFSTTVGARNMTYQWRVNDAVVTQDQFEANQFFITPGINNVSSLRLAVTATHATSVLQQAEGQITILFRKP